MWFVSDMIQLQYAGIIIQKIDFLDSKVITMHASTTHVNNTSMQYNKKHNKTQAKIQTER